VVEAAYNFGFQVRFRPVAARFRTRTESGALEMAMQQYAQPMQRTVQPAQQMQPFGGGADPFGGFMGDMMMPFGGMGGGHGGGGIFGQIDQMMSQMMGGGMGGGQMMGMGGDGGFSCQTMMMSSSMGEDGKMHTERFASSAIGDRARQISEVQQAYSNSNSGMDKMSLERQMANRGRKMVKEVNQFTGEERNTDLYKGMTEAQNAEFDQGWRQNAVPYLPQHVGDVRQLMGPGGSQQSAIMSGFPPAGRPSSQQAPALPSYQQPPSYMAPHSAATAAPSYPYGTRR